MIDHKSGFQRQAKAKWSAGQGYRLRNCQQGVFGVAADAPLTTVHMWLYSRSLPHLSPTTSNLSVSSAMNYISLHFKGMLVLGCVISNAHRVSFLPQHHQPKQNKTTLFIKWLTNVRPYTSAFMRVHLWRKEAGSMRRVLQGKHLMHDVT